MILRLRDIMLPGLGIVRDKDSMEESLSRLQEMQDEGKWNKREIERLEFARAILMSAIYRQESRGAHYRSDFPETKDEFKGMTTASYDEGVQIGFRKTAQ